MPNPPSRNPIPPNKSFVGVQGPRGAGSLLKKLLTFKLKAPLRAKPKSPLPAGGNTTHTHKDPYGARISMWLFLFTEVLLFGGLFLLYAVYRSKFPGDFHFCAGGLDTAMGAVNTAVLLTSSLTMVLAVAHLERKNRKYSAIFLSATIMFGFLFLINKFFEWSAKFAHGLYPNSEILQQHTAGENIFYSLYYLVTGLHGLHIVIGMVILAVMLFMVMRKTGQEDQLLIKVENSGLYWHLVGVIWIFLFPLFYLIT